jgi:hypothetical protein
MRHKVAELEGALLDAAVAKAENDPRISMWGAAPWIDDGTVAGQGMSGRGYCPSTDWCDGGPIIDREKIFLGPPTCVGDYGEWGASLDGVDYVRGPTALVAAMRAYVASKFGDEVELP